MEARAMSLPELFVSEVVLAGWGCFSGQGKDGRLLERMESILQVIHQLISENFYTIIS